MKPNLLSFLKRIQNTQNEEINCSECLDQISRYVDLDLETGKAGQELPEVKQHLEQCQVCFEEYQALRGLVRGEAPSSTDLIERLKRGREE